MAVRDEDSTTATATLPGAVRAQHPTDDEATAFFQRGAQADAEECDDEATRVAGGLDLVPDELRDRDVLSEPAIADDDVETVIGLRNAPSAPAAGRRSHPSLAEVVAGRVPASRFAQEAVSERSPDAPHPSPGVPSQIRVAPPQAPTAQQPAAYAPAPPVAPYAPAPPVAAYAPAASPPASAPPLARISAPTPPPVDEPRGAPRIFVLVMSFCGVFTATGLALLAYLKVRHLW